MKLFVITETVPHETYNEFHGVFSTKELAEAFLLSLPGWDAIGMEIEEVELDEGRP
jgi:hypothetical protein